MSINETIGFGTTDAFPTLVAVRARMLLERELNIFRNNRSRMHYRKASDAGCPIGSCSVESCNKFLIAQRLKRSGQRWGQTGGQAVLTIRSLVKSVRFDQTSQRLRQYWRTVRPVPTRHPPPTTALAA